MSLPITDVSWPSFNTQTQAADHSPALEMIDTVFSSSQYYLMLHLARWKVASTFSTALRHGLLTEMTCSI
jgi:hypothetical protein